MEVRQLLGGNLLRTLGSPVSFHEVETGSVSLGEGKDEIRTDTIRSIVIKMINRHCGAIPVVEDDRRLVGIVTLRDVILPLYPNYGDYIHDAVHSRDFVEMEEGADEAIAALDNKEYGGRRLKVNIARPRDEGPRRR